MVGIDAYAKARKQGLKAYHNSLQRGLNPSLPVLEEVEPQLTGIAACRWD